MRQTFDVISWIVGSIGAGRLRSVANSEFGHDRNSYWGVSARDSLSSIQLLQPFLCAFHLQTHSLIRLTDTHWQILNLLVTYRAKPFRVQEYLLGEGAVKLVFCLFSSSCEEASISALSFLASAETMWLVSLVISSMRVLNFSSRCAFKTAKGSSGTDAHSWSPDSSPEVGSGSSPSKFKVAHNSSKIKATRSKESLDAND